MASRRPQREESWDSLHYSEVSTETSENIDADDDVMEDEGTPHLRTIGDVHKALHPLQATADRVGRQVEKFAEILDRLGDRESSNAPRSVTDVIPMIWEFGRIAVDTVRTLKRYHEKDRELQLKRAWRRRLRKKASEASVLATIEPTIEGVEGNFSTTEDLLHWEQELRTWQLLRLMLQVKDPAASKDPRLSDNEERFRRPTRPSAIHRYSPESDVWNSYLAEDEDMWERNVVVEWLKISANTSGLEIDEIIEAVDTGPDGLDPLAIQGWLYSKEAIKAQKRLRAWPQPLDPGSPGLDATLTTTGQSEGTITQLDPDAVTRQDRALAKKDHPFEQAIWLACWEMVRRGRSWESIREWCQERAEGWRALSLRGDPRSSYSMPNVNNDSTMDWQSRSLWRKMCLRVAQEGGTDDFEKAVYGVLSGDLQSVLRVADGWDDYLFALYNSQLLEGFDAYIRKSFPDRLPKLLRQEKSDFGNLGDPYKTPPKDAWEGLLKAEPTKAEARRPMKMIQGSIIADEVVQFINGQGHKLGQQLGTSEQPSSTNGSSPEISVDDHDILRILTHISFLFMEIRPTSAAENFGPIENIIFAYVDYLGKAGKQQLLPLYASRLSAKGAVKCMARQLPYITDHSERRTVLKLMQQYGIDVAATLKEQLLAIMAEEPAKSSSSKIPKLGILDKQRPGLFGTPSIVDEFMGRDVTESQLDLIHAVEWYLLLDGHWQDTMWAGKEAYLYFFRTGALAAAKELAKRVNFSAISLSKTRYILGKAVDLSEKQDFESDETRLEYDILLSQATVFRDLEDLVLALCSFEPWMEMVNDQPPPEVLKNKANKAEATQWRQELRVVLENVQDSVSPVLTSSWLQQPENESEATSLSSLRLAYLPDITLAYISVLTYGGQSLTRDHLSSIMDLAARIAEDSEPLSDSSSSVTSPTGLAAIFMETGRMAELVDILARASVCLATSDEKEMEAHRGKSSSKPRKGGGSTCLWRVPGLGTDVERHYHKMGKKFPNSKYAKGSKGKLDS